MSLLLRASTCPPPLLWVRHNSQNPSLAPLGRRTPALKQTEADRPQIRGEKCCGWQAGDASGTGLFDTAARRFDEGRMHSIDPSLPEFFPELVGPNEVTAHLRQLRPSCVGAQYVASNAIMLFCSELGDGCRVE